jgi:hypothetical protein
MGGGEAIAVSILDFRFAIADLRQLIQKKDDSGWMIDDRNLIKVSLQITNPRSIRGFVIIGV